MDIENILELVGADKLAPEIRGQITELLELLIADPKYTPALEKVLSLIGADRLDAPTQETIKENLLSVIDAAAKDLLNEIGPTKAVELKQIRRAKFEKGVISRLYCSAGKDKEPLSENSDPDIEQLAKKNADKTISKTNWLWNRGLFSDPMKEATDPISKKDYNWDRNTPLSGMVYSTNTKRGRS